MKVLKAPTVDVKNRIEGLTNGTHLIRFILDMNNNWVVGKQILNDSKFLHLHYDLQQLEEIDYNPIIEDGI